jgi:LytS/YehU family sensor histidine kinase
VKNYLALEQIRFEDRLKVHMDIDEDTLSQQVPPMMLQTLVENAIKHGISKEVYGGKVEIVSDFVDDHHEIVIRNTGRLSEEVHHEGFGLSSTRNRLQLLYDGKASFDIKETNGKEVEARVVLPVGL